MGDRIVVRGLHYRTGRRTAIGMADDRFVASDPNHEARLSPRSEAEAGGDGDEWRVADPGVPGSADPDALVAPGLVDLQVNGYKGLDFNAGGITTELVHRMTRELWAQGVTSYCPTLITNGDSEIEETLRTIAAACSADRMTALSIAGVHLEGPFISPCDGPRGAHDARFVRAPDIESVRRWQDAAEGRIRLLTLSPEWPEAGSFIRECADLGIRTSIGHTAAATEQIREAVAAGAVMSTHLGNGMHPALPRHPNYMWDQLAEDALSACFIGDGHHLPDAVIRVIWRVKGDRALLVSDAVHLCGLPAGRYRTHIGGDVVLTPEGRLHLAGNPALLAGSAQLQLAAINRMIRGGLCGLAEAWEAASVRPAKVMGLPTAGGLFPGALADLVLLDHDPLSGCVQVRETFKAGVSVYRRETGTS